MSPLIRLMFWRRPLDCHAVAELLHRYLDNELDPRRSERIAAHLTDCRRCGMEVDTYRHIKRALRERDADIPHASLARLRDFADRLARGEPMAL